MTAERHTLSLVLNSHVDALDYVQVVCDQLCAAARLNEDELHWVGVAVRESVINAMRHGNRFDPAKHVHVQFAFVPADAPTHFEVSVQDEGEGFDPEEIADPLSPENLLKSSGRGIFFMRNFMDDVELRRRPEGGMEVLMRKRLAAG
ncbi:MAG: ATP-binding protein [Acidobacteria bacterium]|nr:ATP-binding protein [Acidobacteriota bacterium]